MCTAATRRSTCLAEKAEQWMLNSDQMNNQIDNSVTDPDSDYNAPAFTSGADRQSLCVCVERDFNLTWLVRAHYHRDPLFMKILHHLEAHPPFRIRDWLIWTKNQMGRDVVCVPQKAFIWGRRLIEVILDQAHTTIGHFGQLSTSCYVWRFYWWPSMGADIELFCSSCAPCQTMKDSMQKPARLLHSLPIPDQPWQSVRLDFMGPLPKSKGYNHLLVVIDRDTSQVHLLPMTTRATAKAVGSPLPHRCQVAGAPLPPTLPAVYMPADIPVEVDIPLPKKSKDDCGAHVFCDPMEDMFNWDYTSELSTDDTPNSLKRRLRKKKL